jgi:cobalt-zinc-cadmium efflux system membrane fusion protein
VFVGCKHAEEKETTEKQRYVLPDTLASKLEIDTVKISQLTDAITLTGKVAFNDDNVVPVYPMVSGNIQEIKVMLGDYVNAGQVLAVIKSTEMAGYSNDLVNAESNVKVTKKNLDATQDMFNSGLTSQKDLLTAEAGYEQAKSALSRVNKVLKINGGNTNGDFTVKAPISGFIVQKLATNNMVIRTDNNTSLFTISDLKNVWIIANVYESNISLVHTGDDVDITTLSYPNKIFKGKVDKIMNVLDPANKVMKVRVVLPNENYLLKPEMFANVTVNNKENKKVLSIPSTALIFDHSQYFILVYKSNKDIQIVPVEVINTVGNKTYLAGGVQEGDKIIASQALLIYDALNS